MYVCVCVCLHVCKLITIKKLKRCNKRIPITIIFIQEVNHWNILRVLSIWMKSLNNWRINPLCTIQHLKHLGAVSLKQIKLGNDLKPTKKNWTIRKMIMNTRRRFILNNCCQFCHCNWLMGYCPQISVQTLKKTVCKAFRWAIILFVCRYSLSPTTSSLDIATSFAIFVHQKLKIWSV